MKNHKKTLDPVLTSFLKDDSGATAIEYGLIAALIGIGIIAGARAMSGSVNGMFTDVDNDLGEAFD